MGKEDKNENTEIREYSIRENIFFTTLVAVGMPELFERFPKEEIMAVVIEISEQFETEHPDGTTEELERNAAIRLKKCLKD